MHFYFPLFLFALGTWTAVNFIWAEMPLLVSRLPEGWKLPSVLSMLVALANIFAFIIAFIKWRRKSLNEIPLIYIVFLVSFVSCVLLVFTWSKTVFIKSSYLSVPLYILVFFMSSCAILCNVTFLPYIHRLSDTASFNVFFIGQSFTSLIPAIFTTIQGISKTQSCTNNQTNQLIQSLENFTPKPIPLKVHRLSFESSIILCIIITSLSFSSFLYMERKRVNKKPPSEPTKIMSSNIEEDTEVKTDLLLPDTGDVTKEVIDKPETPLSEIQIHILYGLTFICGFLLFGVIPGIGSYAFLPYGNATYFWASILNLLASPIACLLSFIFTRIRYSILLIISLIAYSCCAYVIIMAAQSPCSFLHKKLIGTIIVIFVSHMAILLMIFVRNTIASVLRTTKHVNDAVFWFGVVMQLGAVFGATILLLLINVFRKLKARDPCKNECR